MDEFFKLYDQLREEYPLYLVFKSVNNRRWRLEVYGRKMAENGSDASIITVEHDSRAQCFLDGLKLLEGSRARLEKLTENLSQVFRAFKNHL